MIAEILGKLKEDVQLGNKVTAEKNAKEAVQSGMDLVAIIKELSQTMQEVGEKFSRMEIFLSGLVKSGDAMKAVTKVFAPILAENKTSLPVLGRIVLGTVKGDIHDIGTNIVSAMLAAAGFEVHDIGVDVPTKKFIEKAEEVDADIIAASALLTSTMPYQREIIEFLKAKGLREKYKVMIGGGPTSKAWAEEIGADAWARDASKAAKEAKRILK